jgi:hypothetical protein
MPTARDHAAAAVLDGRIYVTGGRPGSLAVTEVYRAASDDWTTDAPLPLGRSSIAAVALDGHFVVIGGEDSSERRVYSEVDALDPQTHQWTRLPELPSGRQGIGAVVVGRRLYVPGGGPSGGGGAQAQTLYVLS